MSNTTTSMSPKNGDRHTKFNSRDAGARSRRPYDRHLSRQMDQKMTRKSNFFTQNPESDQQALYDNEEGGYRDYNMGLCGLYDSNGNSIGCTSDYQSQGEYGSFYILDEEKNHHSENPSPTITSRRNSDEHLYQDFAIETHCNYQQMVDNLHHNLNFYQKQREALRINNASHFPQL